MLSSKPIVVRHAKLLIVCSWPSATNVAVPTIEPVAGPSSALILSAGLPVVVMGVPTGNWYTKLHGPRALAGMVNEMSFGTLLVASLEIWKLIGNPRALGYFTSQARFCCCAGAAETAAAAERTERTMVVNCILIVIFEKTRLPEEI